jgi:hypothetical protein
MAFVCRDFVRRWAGSVHGRPPPGQDDVGDRFPVLSASPTSHRPLTPEHVPMHLQEPWGAWGMSSTGSWPSLLGRRSECDRLRGLVAAKAGRSHFLVLRGEAGIDKTVEANHGH